jgi:uncharacterized protein
VFVVGAGGSAARLSRDRMIGSYPDLFPIELADREILDPLFRALPEGVSEFSFAGIYCFRESHGYRVTRLADGTIVLCGADNGKAFFVCPFRLPRADLLDQLFQRFTVMKLVTERQAEILRQGGFLVSEDRDNFDYLYPREALASLAGRALQRKRNLVHQFTKHHDYQAFPVVSARTADALAVLETWRKEARDQADYAPARDALMLASEFGLSGSIYYVGQAPAGYCLGEFTAGGTMFVAHYEKTVPGMKGLYQLINMNCAAALPATCTLINREQDLGDPGLRQAKITYRPSGFVKKYRARRLG